MKFMLVARRDLAGYLNGYLGYAIIALFTLTSAFVFFAYLAFQGSVRSSTALELFFQVAAFHTAISGILLAMRSIAEERQTRTEMVLHTSPISDGQIVLGKWLAVMGMIVFFLACTVHMPAMLFVHGKLSMSHIAVGYLGLLCYGAAAAGIGVLASSLVRSQVGAAILGLGVLAPLVTMWIGAQLVEPPFAAFATQIDFYGEHFQPFGRGLLETRHFIYYATFTWVTLTLATKVLQRRRFQ